VLRGLLNPLHPVVAAAEKQRLDQIWIEKIYGEPVALLEVAGFRIADLLQKVDTSGVFVFLCGSGNNGADGLVAARWLANWGYPVQVFAPADMRTAEGKQARKALLSCGIEIHLLQTYLEHAGHPDCGGLDCLGSSGNRENQGNQGNLGNRKSLADCSDLLIDCLLGAGATRCLQRDSLFGQIVAHMNASLCPIISVDCPTGLLGTLEPGQERLCVDANRCICLGMIVAELFASSCTATTEIEFVSLNFEALWREIESESGLKLLWGEPLTKQLAQRAAQVPVRGHKLEAGAIACLGGVGNLQSALDLAARASSAAGAGYVQALFLGDKLQSDAYLSHSCGDWTDGVSIGVHKRTRVLVLGPGTNQYPDIQTLSKQMLEMHDDLSAVVDAGALRSFVARDFAGVPTVLTPHPGEAAALLNCTVQEISEKPIQSALKIADMVSGVCVLKGETTVVVESGTERENAQGMLFSGSIPALATAGSGDVLSGIVASLMLRFDAFEAAVLGVAFHRWLGCKLSAQGGAVDAGDLVAECKRMIRYEAVSMS
jgi:hydroxyethylthiazole kinase-like uncharacterized protein yjeF